MKKTKIAQLYAAGQSAWLDYLSRPLLQEGRLKEMVALGLRGVTSNPTIFDKAIASTTDYDLRIKELSETDKSTFKIYDELTVQDIQNAADILRPVYAESKGLDGYVSLEVDPRLAYQPEETIQEAQRLWSKVNRPNLMLKIPATPESFRAIEELLALGININVTLIFSLAQYKHTALTYIKGAQRFYQGGGAVKQLHSVASVFVSRLDTLVDERLEALSWGKSAQEKSRLQALKGKAAVSNAKLIYKEYLDIFSAGEFKGLKKCGVNLQRVLWGSTSTKDPAYSDIKYVVELIGKNTVNTLPEPTFRAFLDHGTVAIALGPDISEPQQLIAQLKELGIDIEAVCQELLVKGVTAFQQSFASLLRAIETKRSKLCCF